MKVEMLPVVDITEIFNGLDKRWGDFIEFEDAENGHYVFVNTDEDALIDAEDNLEWERQIVADGVFDISNGRCLTLAENTVALIRFLRAEGYTDGIIVHCWW